MRKIALGITATVALLVAAVLLAVVTGWVPRGPMNHGWDWPWHDWWHSRLGQSRLHQHSPTMTHTQMLGWVDSQTVMNPTGIRSTQFDQPSAHDQR
jgi:hypothetical protein